jgi:hypothetical protein
MLDRLHGQTFRHASELASTLLLLGVMTAVAHAQQSGNSGMPDMPGMSHQSAPVSAKAHAQIAEVAHAVRELSSTTAAAGAGFRPVFGWIPTMGVHWIDHASMMGTAPQNLLKPDNLMFSRIAGRDSLVGAAYAYFGSADDSTRPNLFDGAPPWHEHPDLAPPGETLTMLHVWFVPSPDGAFAGTNPNLPFWAAALDAPDASRMHDPAFSSRVRRASLALAEVVDTTSILPQLERRPQVRAAIVAHRDSVRALIPALLNAQRAHDAAAWDHVADQLAAQWDAMDAIYIGAARTADGRARIERFIAMLLGEHHAH